MDDCREECLDEFLKKKIYIYIDDFLRHPIDDFIDEFVNDFLE